jgi:DNA polymerase III delta prime subunit
MTDKLLTHLKNSNLPVILIGTDNLDGLKNSLKVDEGDYLAVKEEVIKIENTREIIRFLSLKPFNSQIKLVIISLADKMTIVAANNLLKTLEEPPAYARIILTTYNEKLILPTIMSRVRKIKIPIEENLIQPENYLPPDDLAKMSVAKKFSWVSEVIESSDLELILTFWQQYFRKKMMLGENVTRVLKEISRAKDLLLTNISVKLLLENLVLEFIDEK